MSLTRAHRATAGAHLRGVVRGNIDNVEPVFQCLVGQEFLQLAEGPGVVAQALLALDLDSLPDVGQVLQHNRISRLQAINDTPTDHMIEVLHPVAFSTRQPGQHPFARACAFTLKRLPQLGVTPPDVQGLPTAELQAIGRSGQVRNTQIHANDAPLAPLAARRVGSGHRRRENHVEIELLSAGVVAESSRGRLLPGEQATLVVADRQLDLATAHDRAQANPELAILFEPEQVFVEVEAGRPEQLGPAPGPTPGPTPSCTPGFDGPYHASESPDDIVCCEAVTRFEGVVEPAMKRVRIRNLVSQGKRKSVIARLRIFKQCLLQGFTVLRRDLQFALHGFNKAHEVYYIYTER